MTVYDLGKGAVNSCVVDTRRWEEVTVLKVSGEILSPRSPPSVRWTITKIRRFHPGGFKSDTSRHNEIYIDDRINQFILRYT
jgi:hypothetical protein